MLRGGMDKVGMVGKTFQYEQNNAFQGEGLYEVYGCYT
jgi:hypothetical protein